MKRFAWLHLSDWHFGMQGHAHLWPNIRQQFFDDLELLHKKCGPWHAVFFTGDFVQRGAAEEFQGVDGLLGQLWQRLEGLGSHPVLLGVPGNHDLSRPGSSPESLVLTRWSMFPDIHEEFWQNSSSPYRKVVEEAFAAYTSWWNRCRFYGSVKIRPGILPGDYSTTVKIGGLKIGVLGLNTAFLQLTGGDYKGKLALDSRQFHQACGGDGPEWIDRHHCCILLTHHGPEWLNEQSRDREYPEINPAGRFAVHLFGHMHESVLRGTSIGGGPLLRTWQGHSLFGLEHYGDEYEEERQHGYSGGQIEFAEEGGLVRHWPRVVRRHGPNGWIIVPDYETCLLEDDQGTRPDPIDVRIKVDVRTEATARPAPETRAPKAPATTAAGRLGDLEALKIWREKLDYFRKELAITADPAQKFNLRNLIEEAERMIKELGG